MATTFPHPMEAVFSTWELLEAIFLQLDVSTILLSILRVNKAWNHVVSTSPALQQAIYFKPISTPYQEGKESAINPLLVDKFGSCFFDFGPTYGFFRRAESFYTLPWTARPHQTVRTYEGPYREPQHKVALPTKLDDQTVHDGEKDRERFTLHGASWRRMLISQPPPRHLGALRLEAEFLWGGEEKVMTALVPSDNPEGLCMGQIYDLLQFWAGHHERHSLWFRVTWGQLQSPFQTTLHQRHCEKLLAQTNVLVESFAEDDFTYQNHARDPANVALFDSVFRCNESCQAEVELQEAGVQTLRGYGIGTTQLVWSSSYVEHVEPEYLVPTGE